MSVDPIWTVFCDGDGCGQWCSETQPSRPEARVAAKAMGWTEKRTGDRTLNLCPRCSTAGSPEEGE